MTLPILNTHLERIGTARAATLAWICERCGNPAMLTDIGIFCSRCEEEERDYREMKEGQLKEQSNVE